MDKSLADKMRLEETCPETTKPAIYHFLAEQNDERNHSFYLQSQGPIIHEDNSGGNILLEYGIWNKLRKKERN